MIICNNDMTVTTTTSTGVTGETRVSVNVICEAIEVFLIVVR